MKVTLSDGREIPHLSWGNMQYANSVEDPYEEWAKTLHENIDGAVVELDLDDVLVLATKLEFIDKEIEAEREVERRRGQAVPL